MDMSSIAAISRVSSTSGVRYVDARGLVRDAELIEWITSLAIPPAWEEVRISRSKKAKVLASGRDVAGRKQAIYNPTFRAKQEQLKFDRMLRFAKALPGLRRQLEKDLKRHRLSKEKVLACVVRLIDQAYFRVGNQQYAAQNQHYGITTLRRKHVDISGHTVTFEFIGKSGQEHVKQITDKQIARIVKQLDELPGYEVFRYKDQKGGLHDIASHDVNDYIKRQMGEEFSAKDFRTWGGTLLATTELIASERYDTKKERQKAVTSIVKTVAKRLGNTPAIARGSYIDPRVIAAYIDSSEITQLKTAMATMHPKKYMTADEQCVLRLLEAA